MEDHRLGDLLRELPREPARPGFTAGVLRRIENSGPRERRQRRLSPRVALAGALALTLTVAAGVLVEARREIETARTRQALQALKDIRAEHGRLEREVEELSQPSVVYLGGNENVDLVLDLGKVRGTEGAKPAAYHDETF